MREQKGENFEKETESLYPSTMSSSKRKEKNKIREKAFLSCQGSEYKNNDQGWFLHHLKPQSGAGPPAFTCKGPCPEPRTISPGSILHWGGLPATHSGAGARLKHTNQPTNQTTNRRSKPISCVRDKYVQPCLNSSLLLFIASSPLLKFPVMSHCTALGECVYFCQLRSIPPQRAVSTRVWAGKKKLLPGTVHGASNQRHTVTQSCSGML